MMDLVTFGSSPAMEVDRCSRCGGIWFDRGELDHLGTMPDESRAVLTVAAADRPPALCHQCHAPIDRAAPQCAGCGHENRIQCPRCERSMEVVRRSGLALDVCRPCEGVWFDQAELEAIWTASLHRALEKRGASRPDGLGKNAVASEVALHTVIFMPEHLLGAGIASAAEATGSIGELSGQAFEAVGEAAGTVFDAVVDIIGGIF
jgi:Zn-finger nucleic acid-binding protein